MLPKIIISTKIISRFYQLLSGNESVTIHLTTTFVKGLWGYAVGKGGVWGERESQRMEVRS